MRAFDATPCAELAYIIGVRMGDASMSVTRNYDYKIKLRVTDKEFAEEFSRCLSMVLSRTPPRVKWHEKTHAWHTELSSLLLQTFLRQSLKELRKTIEHCRECSSAFIRGFFDSEGWVYKTELGAANTNREVLLYIQHLLERRFGIWTKGPRLGSKGGRIVMIKGKLYRANKGLLCYPGQSNVIEYFSVLHRVHNYSQAAAVNICGKCDWLKYRS